MANRSTFPTAIDSFIEHTEIRASDRPYLIRYQELMLKTSLTSLESEELRDITSRLRDKLQTAEDFNKLQDAITNLEVFFRDETQGYLTKLQTEFSAKVNADKDYVVKVMNDSVTVMENKKNEFTKYVDNKELELTSFSNALKQDFNTTITNNKQQVITVMNDSVATMESKKKSFESFVDIKEDEIRGLVQDFDSRSTRYYQNWTAQNKQVIYNIFTGNISNFPTEARLMLEEKDIDVVIQGVLLRPNVDYRIAPNGNYDSIELLIDPSLITAGTEVIAKWYKNVGKLYFKHSTTHEYGSTDAIMNIREEQLYPELKEKITTGSIKVSVTKPTTGLWFELV